MKRFLLLLLTSFSLFTAAQGQSINFTADTNTRVQNRWRIAFPNGQLVIVPPVGGGAATPVSTTGTGAVSSVNNQTGAVSVTWNNLPSKPTSVSTAFADAATSSQVAAKENAITAGTSGQYYDGTKTFKALNSAAVGLDKLANSLQVVNAGGAVSLASGTLANRPAAGTAGRFYLATDVATTYYDNGSAWTLEQPALSGDVAVPAGSTAATLATVNSNVGSFGSATTVPVPTYDGKGRATSVTQVPISPTGIGSAAVKTFTLTNATNGTILTHNLASLYNIASPVMSGVVYQNGQPDYNITVVRNDDNSVKLVTPLKSDGTNETVTGFARVWVTP